MYAGRTVDEKLWVWLMEAVWLKVKHDYLHGAFPSQVYGREGTFGVAWSHLQLEWSLIDKTVLILCNSLHDPKPQEWFQALLNNATLQGTPEHDLFKVYYDKFTALAGRLTLRPGARGNDTVLEHERASVTFAHLNDVDPTTTPLLTYEETVQLLACGIQSVALYLTLHHNIKNINQKINKLMREGKELVAKMYNQFIIKPSSKE
jgi:hypothetical protein